MRAAVYLRQSFDPNDDRLAITRQREDCLAVCAARGWTPVEYTDNDTSASTGKPRPAYQRMLADIRAGKVGAVVAWDLDRLHRRPIELEEFIDLADEHRIALATAGVSMTSPPTADGCTRGSRARSPGRRSSASLRVRNAPTRSAGRTGAGRRVVFDRSATHDEASLWSPRRRR